MKQRTKQFAWKSANPSPATFCPSAKVPKGEGACNGTSNEPASESTTTTSSIKGSDSLIEDEPAKPKTYTGGPVRSGYTGAGMVTRSSVANALFPYKKGKEAGAQVVSDILNHEPLHTQMVEAGWRQKEKGYTPEMIAFLSAYYARDILSMDGIERVKG